MRNARQQVIDDLRRKQKRRHNDWFFDSFEHDEIKVTLRKMVLVWLGLLVVSLVFWGAIIAMVVIGLSFVI